MKPIPLLAYPIMNSSMSNAIVLDPFGGSGSTLIACEQTDRVCRTIELDEKFCDVIVKRYIEQVGDTKTKLSKRALAISQIALPYIQEAKQKAGSRSAFLFGGAKPLTYTQHRQMMRRICDQMEMKGVTGYTFRHTIITDIYEATHDANIASAVAGHSKTSITMNRYSHARQDAAKRGMRAIDEAYDL